LRARLSDVGYDPIGSTPAEYAAHIDREIEKWTRIITAGNIKPE